MEHFKNHPAEREPFSSDFIAYMTNIGVLISVHKSINHNILPLPAPKTPVAQLDRASVFGTYPKTITTEIIRT
jgi:hypothetical protein